MTFRTPRRTESLLPRVRCPDRRGPFRDVNGPPYVAVRTGLGEGRPGLVPSLITPDIHYPNNRNAIYVFALHN